MDPDLGSPPSFLNCVQKFDVRAEAEAQKPCLKVKICNINFRIENDPRFCHFSKNSADLVAEPFPYCPILTQYTASSPRIAQLDLN